MSRRRASLGVHLALVVLGIVTIAPLLWMVSASLMPAGAANSLPPPLLPRRPTLEHYVELLTRLSLLRCFFNSLMIASLTTVVSMFLNALAGYAFAKLRFPGRDRVFAWLLVGLAVPSQIGMLPLFLVVKGLGLVNTPWGVIITGLASIFGIFLIRQYALSIPDELLDAARVDGASEFHIFRTIVLPLMRPILVTLGAFIFLGTWNDFLWPLIITSSDQMRTLPVGLALLSRKQEINWGATMAGTAVAALPMIAIFLVLQRRFIEGLTSGAVKG